ncbi:hypothetical protein M8818_001076 [Zalaria obscura]|uniref:Uncharacterized protein n=1 Tax=Zalaria obscura TaxID=2024903 RepID=A0ACC3SMF6_9PEZI
MTTTFSVTQLRFLVGPYAVVCMLAWPHQSHISSMTTTFPATNSSPPSMPPKSDLMRTRTSGTATFARASAVSTGSKGREPA